MHEATWFLLTGLLLASSVGLAIIAARASVPFLVVFLGFGMLLGSEGLNVVGIHEAELVRAIGIVGLAVILFEGGLSTSIRRLRHVAVPAIMLSTVGVVATTFLAGLIGHWLFDLSWLESFLLGAVVSSTDAAAVFATLRFTPLKRQIARTLEAESGLNDPLAIALTIGLATWLTESGYGANDLLILIAKQIFIGLLAGGLLGLLAAKVFSNLPKSVGAFAPVASLAACAVTYGATDLLGGSGFMAVYLVGLAIGTTPSRYRSQLTIFHEGSAFVAQVLLFVILGLFVTPSHLGNVAISGFIFTLILVVLIRPLAVILSTFGLKFSLKHRFLMGWAGLRGAVPIVLATLVLAKHVESAQIIFDIVFFVVLFSVLLQGITLPWMARKLDGVEATVTIEPEELSKPKRTSFTVRHEHAIAGVELIEIGLPPWARVASVKRDGKQLVLSRQLILQPDDVLTIVCPSSHMDRLEDVMIRWRRSI